MHKGNVCQKWLKWHQCPHARSSGRQNKAVTVAEHTFWATTHVGSMSPVPPTGCMTFVHVINVSQSASLSNTITSITSQKYTGMMLGVWLVLTRTAMISSGNELYVCWIIHKLICNFIKKGAEMGLKKVQQPFKVAFKWMVISWHKRLASLAGDYFSCIMHTKPVTVFAKNPI